MITVINIEKVLNVIDNSVSVIMKNTCIINYISYAK